MQRQGSRAMVSPWTSSSRQIAHSSASLVRTSSAEKQGSKVKRGAPRMRVAAPGGMRQWVRASQDHKRWAEQSFHWRQMADWISGEPIIGHHRFCTSPPQEANADSSDTKVIQLTVVWEKPFHHLGHRWAPLTFKKYSGVPVSGKIQFVLLINSRYLHYWLCLYQYPC